MIAAMATNAVKILPIMAPPPDMVKACIHSIDSAIKLQAFLLSL